MALRLATGLASLAALVFLSAGRWNWPEGSASLLAYGIFRVLCAAWWLWKDPAQLKERSRLAANVKAWDKMIVAANTLCRGMTVVVAGLDAGRFHWSRVPRPIEVLAWVLPGVW